MPPHHLSLSITLPHHSVLKQHHQTNMSAPGQVRRTSRNPQLRHRLLRPHPQRPGHRPPRGHRDPRPRRHHRPPQRRRRRDHHGRRPGLRHRLRQRALRLVRAGVAARRPRHPDHVSRRRAAGPLGGARPRGRRVPRRPLPTAPLRPLPAVVRLAPAAPRARGERRDRVYSVEALPCYRAPGLDRAGRQISSLYRHVHQRGKHDTPRDSVSMGPRLHDGEA